MLLPCNNLLSPLGRTWRAAAPAGVESNWCVSFDGVDDKTSAFGVADNVSATTIAMWVKRDAGQYCYAGSYYNGNYCGWELYPDTCYINCGLAWGQVSHSPDGLWHHYAYTFDGSKTGNENRLKFYIDGVPQVLSFTNTVPSQITTRFILGYRDWSAAYSKMMVDDVRVFDGRALDSTEVAALANNTSNITTGLTFHLPLEEGTGTTTVDSVGGATATLVGGATWHPQTPPELVSGRETSVRSLSFDGVDDKTSAFGVADNVSAFTLAVWIKRNVGEYGFVASYYSNGITGNYVGLELSPATAYVNCGPTQYATVSHSADGLWHHYVMVFDGSQTGNSNRLKVYIDGELQSSAYTGTIPATVHTRFIIGWRDWSSRYAKMIADDARVYFRAIDSTGIQKLCRGQNPTTNDPVGWWKGDETSGTLVTDYGSGGNDGTCVGGVTRSTDVPAWLAL